MSALELPCILFVPAGGQGYLCRARSILHWVHCGSTYHLASAARLACERKTIAEEVSLKALSTVRRRL